MKKKTALVGFMLINVFFGIIGTFWLRTQARQGEMGLRIALGSNRSQLSRLMNLEGLVLLGLTIPFLLVFILNMLYFELPDTVRLPYTWWRFAVTFGGAYLLMGGMSASVSGSRYARHGRWNRPKRCIMNKITI